MSYAKPLPVPDPQTQPFWDGCRAGKLLIQRCGTCGTHRFPPTGVCAACGSEATEWVAATGRGKVFSWIVVELPIPKATYAQDVPYAVALVDLEEGVRMATNVVGCDPYAITAGMPVRVRFDAVTEEISLPRFVPDSGGAGDGA